MNKKSKIIMVTIIVFLLIMMVFFTIKTNKRQVELSARNKNMIKVEGFEYKDLNNNGKLDDYENWNLNPEQRAEDLVSQMNIEEKAGMMLIHSQLSATKQTNKELTSMNGLLNEQESTDNEKIYLNYTGNTTTIKDLNIRHIILREYSNPEEIAIWENAMNELAESSRLGIPIVFTSNPRNNAETVMTNANDIQFTQYPTQTGIAAAAMGEEKKKGQSDIIQNFAEIVKKELVATGIRKGYMYSADLMTDPRWARNSDTCGEDVNFVSDTIQTLVKTIQGGDSLSKTGVALTIKHFPGSGARVNGQDAHLPNGRYSPYYTENSLTNYHLPPFQSAINANVSSILPYYSQPDPNSAKQIYKGQEINMEGSSYAYNNEFLTNLLRKNMDFKGYINTDSGVVDFIAWGEETKTNVEKVAKAINSGVDLISDTYHVEWILQAVEEGLVEEERINESVKRVLEEMFTLGIFENPYVEEKETNKKIATKQAMDKAYEVHQKSVVLLKNKDETIPIQAKQKENRIKVYLKEFGTTGRIMLDALNLGDNNFIEVVKDEKEADYLITYIAGKVTKEVTYELDLKNSVIGEEYEEWVKIGNTIKENGGKRITIINFKTAYMVDGIEQNTDCLIGGFNTYTSAIMDIIVGKTKTIGVLPFTLPANEKVVAIDENGNCASPNDVPGYDKNKYMKNGLRYEYIDELGNSYICGYGL